MWTHWDSLSKQLVLIKGLETIVSFKQIMAHLQYSKLISWGFFEAKHFDV